MKKQERKLVNLLKEKNYYISFAESITGGMLASTLINVSGASNVIKESYITYSNDIKNKILNVNMKTIEDNDVVSIPVVLEMVKGLYQRTNSNVCASVSGYAETESKNSGYACYAISINGEVILTNKVYIKGKRNTVRKKLTYIILNDICNSLMEK